MTRFGALDVLGAMVGGAGFAELSPHATWVPLGGGVQVLALKLEKQIELKQQLNRDKDRAVLDQLRAALAERSAQK
jgi:hypothetical protein